MSKKIGALLLIGLVCLITLGYIVMSYDSLRTYKSKRDLDTSGEPSGTTSPRKNTQPIFVIQKHDATALHYDLRLEMNGVLKSWAIPKGPSTNPADKRLAIETEDHPMEYASFEGVIPEGHYGAGPVIVWDKGTFINIKEKDGTLISLEKCYNNGHIEVELHGKKIRGGYALIRTHSDDNKNKWLCIKMRDKYADARRKPTNTQPESILSGKTITEIEHKKIKKQRTKT